MRQVADHKGELYIANRNPANAIRRQRSIVTPFPDYITAVQSRQLSAVYFQRHSNRPNRPAHSTKGRDEWDDWAGAYKIQARYRKYANRLI